MQGTSGIEGQAQRLADQAAGAVCHPMSPVKRGVVGALPGLDPAIPLVKRMDTRVKPAYDTFAVAFYFISDSRAA